ncbi:MAG TPA: nucleotidyltransferase family protein [Candidatus Binatia bacterium]
MELKHVALLTPREKGRLWVRSLKRDGLRLALIEPKRLTTLNESQWDSFIYQAKRAGLLARIQILLTERQLLEAVPKQPRMHLESARIIAENEQRVLRWEVNRLQRALAETEVPIILLKGVAYLALNLPNARGRISSDVDILVPKVKIHVVENALLERGWKHIKLDDYDQYFYRTWSHELPPLRHRERMTIVDVHHTILPPTGRLHPDPEKLLAAAVSVDGSRLKVLAPPDMVLHSAAHIFQDGELQQGWRDLVDLDDLLRHFGSDLSFWDQLVRRAEELELSRPLHYGLRYSRLVLDTPIPEHVLAVDRRWEPIGPTAAVMDKLIIAVLRSHSLNGRDFVSALSSWLLYIRSVWLRMPPWLLAKHLLRQTLRRIRGKQT